MDKTKLNPCPLCGGSNIVIGKWASGGMMYIVKCSNPDCPVPEDGYPTGRNLEKIKEEWNRRAKNGFLCFINAPNVETKLLLVFIIRRTMRFWKAMNFVKVADKP